MILAILGVFSSTEVLYAGVELTCVHGCHRTSGATVHSRDKSPIIKISHDHQSDL